jgi:hypothetical protein
VSVQRRRGEWIEVYRLRESVDRRGNEIIEVDPTSTTRVRAAVVPERSSRAEVPGQQQINMVKALVALDTPDVHLWGRVKHDGQEWDIAAPPERHKGAAGTGHFTVMLRERPS